MGREARCAASWGSRSGDVTVLLDSAEIIGARRVSGTSRRSRRCATCAPRATRCGFAPATTRSRCSSAAPPRAGRARSPTPPPSLAAKLGIRAGTRVAVDGAIDDPALAAALAAGERDDGTPELIVARLDDAAELARVLDARAAALARRVPLWVVYTKGRGAPLGETAVRARCALAA